MTMGTLRTSVLRGSPEGSADGRFLPFPELFRPIENLKLLGTLKSVLPGKL